MFHGCQFEFSTFFLRIGPLTPFSIVTAFNLNLCHFCIFLICFALFCGQKVSIFFTAVKVYVSQKFHFLAHLFREKEANEQSWITSFFWRGWKPICNPFLLTIQCMEMATKVKENWMKKHTAKGCLCIGHDMKLSQYVCVCVCVLFLSVYFLFIRSLDS